MAERITEEQVADLQKILASDASVDAKVAQVTAIKTGIKHHNVPDTCVAELFDALRLASRNQHAILVNAGLTSINHLLTRLTRQEPRYITREKKATLDLLVEKMGDQKEKFRSLAVQSLVTLYKNEDARPDVELRVRKVMEESKNAKAKESSLQWLLQAHQECGLKFSSYVTLFMKLLEDGDPGVRDRAKATVIELFQNAPGKAKADLKEKLKACHVRPAIEQAILKELNPRAVTPGLDTEVADAPVEPAPVPRPTLAASVSSFASERPITPLPDTRIDSVEPSYINTTRELDNMFQDMRGYFDDRESEHNWKLREQSIKRLRKLLAGNAATDFYDQFLAGLRGLLDGIIKAVNSLRTSLSQEGCNLVQDIAVTYGPGMDPMVELLMQTLIKLAASTKKIASQNANVCIDTIIARVTYTTRIMVHVTGACTDKNAQPRLYASGWLKTLLNKEAHHKSHIEHGGGLELLENGIKKGLLDPNPGVREKMRSTYWKYHELWPARADALMDTLDSTAQKLLQKDPNNPNAPKRTEPAVRPGMGFSRSTIGPSKSSIRETMMAHRKAAMAARPGSAMEPSRPRPGSAMEISPPRPTRTVSGTSNASAAPSTATRPKAGGLSGAPVRPGARKRPDIPPRPKTAGPYDSRSGGESILSSPPQVRKPVTPRAMVGSPKRTLAKTKPGHKPTSSESSLPTPSKVPGPKSSPAASPIRPSPMRTRLSPGPPLVASRSEIVGGEGMRSIMDTMDSPAPAIASPKPLPPPVADPVEMEIDQPEAGPVATPSKVMKVYEDPPTEVAETAEQPAPPRPIATEVLGDKPVNEAAANPIVRSEGDTPLTPDDELSEKAKQQSRLIDSALNKIKAKSLDVHGFRKFQGIIRDSKAPLADDKFDALLVGLFDFLEDPQTNLPPEKVQDVKAQTLATIKLLLKKHRDHFQPHISKALESLLAARAAYDARTHIVSGLELLADELVRLGDAQEIATVLTRRMAGTDAGDPAGGRSLSMGLHVLKEMVDAKDEYVPTDDELTKMAGLCTRCLESSESGVRMDAVQLCVALHARVGDVRFWGVMKDVQDDPKSLITYYIVKRQREKEANGVGA